MTNEEILAYLKQYQNAGNHIHKEAMSRAIEALELKAELEKELPTLKHIVDIQYEIFNKYDLAEYVEPEIDWSKVPMGTPVRVWNDEDSKRDRTFIACDEQKLFVAIDMATKYVGRWKYAELIEVDDENSNTND